MRHLVAFGIDRAGQYGLTTERNVCLYISVMCMLGSHFDEDPMFPWARAVLDDTTEADQSPRAARLADQALDFQREMAGADNRGLNRAFLQLRRDFRQLLAVPAAGNPQRASLVLRGLFERRWVLIGPDAIQAMIGQGHQDAAACGLPAGPGHLLWWLWMFLAGSGFADDPLLPWLGGLLRDPQRPGPHKVALFVDASERYLHQWLEVAAATG